MTSVLASTVRVVIADDTPDVRILLRMALQANGAFEVVGEAADGRAAIDAVVATRPDVILLDLAMPVMDGLEAIPVLKRQAPETGIVVFSGFEAGRMAEQAMAAGADEYLIKGTRPDEIAGAIRRVSELKRVVGPEVPPASVEAAYRRSNDLLPLLAHELLNSLTVIGGFASTLRAAAAKGDMDLVSQCADVVARHSTQMEALIRTSQDAGRIEIGTVDLNRSVIDLCVVAHETVSDLAAVLDPHPVSVECEGAVVVCADDVRVRQVITNLLTNAAKFSPPSGSIRVAVGASAGFGRVMVTDEGPGIPAGKRETVFELFGRLDHRVAGSGLGLFISRGLARAHGGDLAILDGGPGATFRLSLPLS